MNEKILVFLDNIQRTIIATVVNTTEHTITVNKPVILNVTPTPDKKLQVQLYPLFFREFSSARDDFPTWEYNKSSITVSNVELEPNLIAQYKQMFNVGPTNQASGPVDPKKVIKLFDE